VLETENVGEKQTDRRCIGATTSGNMRGLDADRAGEEDMEEDGGDLRPGMDSNKLKERERERERERLNGTIE